MKDPVEIYKQIEDEVKKRIKKPKLLKRRDDRFGADDVIRMYLERLPVKDGVVITKKELGIAKRISKFGVEAVETAMAEVFAYYFSKGIVPEIGAILKHLNAPYVRFGERVEVPVMRVRSGVVRQGDLYAFLNEEPFWVWLKASDSVFYHEFMGGKPKGVSFEVGSKSVTYLVQKGYGVDYSHIGDFAGYVFGGYGVLVGEPVFYRIADGREYAENCEVLVYAVLEKSDTAVISFDNVLPIHDSAMRVDFKTSVYDGRVFLVLKRAFECGMKFIVSNASEEYFRSFAGYLSKSHGFSWGIEPREVVNLAFFGSEVPEVYLKSCLFYLVPCIIFVPYSLRFPNFKQIDLKEYECRRNSDTASS